MHRAVRGGITHEAKLFTIDEFRKINVHVTVYMRPEPALLVLLGEINAGRTGSQGLGDLVDIDAE